MYLGTGARKARLSLAQGDLAPVENWARQYESFTQKDPAFLDEFSMITLARLRLAQSRTTEAIKLLQQFREDAEAAERMGSVIEILILETLAFAAQGERHRSLISLERALTLAEPEGYIRLFVDEGDPMQLHLLDFRSIHKKKLSAGGDSEADRLLAYTDKLLAAFSQPAPSEKPKLETISETLSERELDILRFIAAGDSNLEIAEHMVLAQSTVKWYINSLYSKLGARSRTHAVALAKELELI
jgi:LuxR family maltose regulon positive regulatory protein